MAAVVIWPPQKQQQQQQQQAKTQLRCEWDCRPTKDHLLLRRPDFLQRLLAVRGVPGTWSTTNWCFARGG